MCDVYYNLKAIKVCEQIFLLWNIFVFQMNLVFGIDFELWHETHSHAGQKATGLKHFMFALTIFLLFKWKPLCNIRCICINNFLVKSIFHSNPCIFWYLHAHNTLMLDFDHNEFTHLYIIICYAYIDSLAIKVSNFHDSLHM